MTGSEMRVFSAKELIQVFATVCLLLNCKFVWLLNVIVSYPSQILTSRFFCQIPNCWCC